jgi:GTPase involved in cell partitioning and DNA repair
MNYSPQDFERKKLHAFKYLYIFRRKHEITADLLSQCNLTDIEDFKNKKPFIRAYEKLQQETGMTDEDLSEAVMIGMWIDEYDRMINMNKDELKEFIEECESDSDLQIADDLREDLEELWSGISDMLDDKKEQRNKFKEIINDNFDNKKEWPDSFPPYS